VRLFGNEVTLAATNGNVQFNGPVNYRVPEGNQATKASEVTPEAAQTPDDLTDPDDRSLIDLGWHTRLVPLTDEHRQPLERIPCWFGTRAYDRDEGPVQLRLERKTDGESAVISEGKRSPDIPDGAWDAELTPIGQAVDKPELSPAEDDRPDEFTLVAALGSEKREEPN
jgi:hypothetical protein